MQSLILNTQKQSLKSQSINIQMYVILKKAKLGMQNKKHFVLIIFCLLYATFIGAQQSAVDSLTLQIKNTSGEQKLILLEKKAKLFSGSKELLPIILEIEQEAKAQNSDKLLAYSYLLKGEYYFGENNIDSLLYYYELIKTVPNEYKHMESQYYFILIQSYINNGYYGLAIHHLKADFNKFDGQKATQKSFHHLLGILYVLTDRYDDAIEEAKKGLKLYSELNNQSSAPINFYEILVSASALNKQYDNAINYCEEIEKEINKKEENDLKKLVVYNLYTTVYIKKGDSVKAKYYLDKMQNISKEQIHNSFSHYLEVTTAEYYSLIGNYEKALFLLNNVLSTYKKENSIDFLSFQIIENKIQIFEKQRNYKDAFFTLKEFSAYKDSINKENIPFQMSTISKEIALEKARIETEKNKAQLQNSYIIIFVLVISILFLFSTIYIIRHNAKKLLEKNKMLFLQFEGLSSIKDQKGSDDDNSLFDRIQRCMREKEQFKIPDLTREDLARELSTNRQYLTEAIKAATGKTFLDYVNQYRLDYARQLLLADNLLPINNIIFDSGFSSSSTFYRLFKERFGMSPNEMRLVKKQLTKS